VEPAVLTPTLLKQTEINKKRSVIKDGTTLNASEEEVREEPVLKRGNAFQTQFEDEEIEEEEEETTQKNQKNNRRGQKQIEDEEEDVVDSTYFNMRAQPYKLDFKPDFFSVRLDNSMLFNRYQPADLNANRFVNPSGAGLVTISLDDLMED